jgi:hypothetical protein
MLRLTLDTNCVIHGAQAQPYGAQIDELDREVHRQRLPAAGGVFLASAEVRVGPSVASGNVCPVRRLRHQTGGG